MQKVSIAKNKQNHIFARFIEAEATQAQACERNEEFHADVNKFQLCNFSPFSCFLSFSPISVHMSALKRVMIHLSSITDANLTRNFQSTLGVFARESNYFNRKWDFSQSVLVVAKFLFFFLYFANKLERTSAKEPR